MGLLISTKQAQAGKCLKQFSPMSYTGQSSCIDWETFILRYLYILPQRWRHLLSQLPNRINLPNQQLKRIEDLCPRDMYTKGTNECSNFCNYWVQKCSLVTFFELHHSLSATAKIFHPFPWEKRHFLNAFISVIPLWQEGSCPRI